MKYQFEQCLKRGKIVRIPVDEVLIAKELQEAGDDFDALVPLSCGGQYEVGDQGYYAQFHALRALVFARG